MNRIQTIAADIAMICTLDVRDQKQELAVSWRDSWSERGLERIEKVEERRSYPNSIVRCISSALNRRNFWAASGRKAESVREGGGGGTRGVLL